MPPPEPPPEFVPFDFRHIAAEDTTDQELAAEELLEVANKLAERGRESLRLYVPLPVQDEFHASETRTRLLPGSNRGGKTLAAAVELARAATGQDPHGKYPAAVDAVLVGGDYDHIGKVIYPMLFMPGAFRIIQDLDTKFWRAYRPWDAEDLKRRRETKKAPPLIPKRFVKSVGWYDKKKRIPTVIALKNGSTLSFYSGKATPPQGVEFDHAWLDEEIPGIWYNEMSARIASRSGRLVWSATPQAGTTNFYDLCELADEMVGTEECSISRFQIRLTDNPHISEKDKADLAAGYTDPNERKVRIDGEFLVNVAKVFPEYSRVTHGIAPFDVPLRWTRYAVVDPGRAVCAVLFAAAPDPVDVDPKVYDLLLYDELYITSATAEKFGEMMLPKCRGVQFEKFIIDTHGSRIHESGSGRTVYDQYAAALSKRGIRSEKTGSKFEWGIANPKGGIELFRSYLETRPKTGTPRVRVIRGKLPKFDFEIDRYRFARVDGTITDNPQETAKPTHLMACCRYLVLAKPRYVPPASRSPILDPVVSAFLKQQRRRSREEGPRTIHFGPPARENAG